MIFLDPRVGSRHLAPIFAAMKVPYEVSTLEFGDCAFLGNGPDGPVKVGIEIKGGRGGSDFLTSMQSGRLVGHQIPGLVPNYERRYLIVEGVRPNKNGVIWMPPTRGRRRVRPVFDADVRKFLTGIEENDVRVRRTSTPKHTARMIHELFLWWQKDYDSHSSIARNVLYSAPLFSLVKEDEVTARLRRVLVALKAGVGAGRSKAVAQHFGSVRALSTSDTSDWEGIDGVGKKIAGDVVAACREQIPSHVSGSCVSAGHVDAPRSARTPRQRQNTGLDAGKTPQRRVQPRRAGHRATVRGRAQ